MQCFKELDEQAKFQRSMRDFSKKEDQELAESIIRDVESFKEEQQKKICELTERNIKYRAELKKQLVETFFMYIVFIEALFSVDENFSF